MSTAFPDRCPVCDCDLRRRTTAGQSPSGSERAFVQTPTGTERPPDDASAQPPPRRCPDCGFTYDERTRIWQSGESWALLGLRYAIAGLVLGLVISLLYRMSVNEAPYPMLPLALGLIAPAVGLAIRRLISGRIAGRFVALTPVGIVVGTRPRPTIILWADFDRVTEQRGILKLQRRNDPVLIPLDDIFARPDQAADFRQAVTHAARQHRHPPPNHSPEAA